MSVLSYEREAWTISESDWGGLRLFIYKISGPHGSENEYYWQIFIIQLLPLTTDLTVAINKKKTPWFWSASKLCRTSDRRFLAK
jgi:hypothetical protein